MSLPIDATALHAKFQTLPESVRTELMELKPAVEPELQRVLKTIVDGFRIPDAALAARMVERERSVVLRVLEGRFDAGLVEEIATTALERYRAGIPMEAVFTILTGEINGLMAPVVARFRRKPERIVSALAALNRVLMIRSEIAISAIVAAAEKEAAEASGKRIQDFEASIGRVIDSLHDSSATLRLAAQTMAGSADETSRESATVASAAGQASGNVQTVASAAEELSAAISEIARQVSQSSTIARKAADEARKTDVTIDGLSQAASKIGEIVKLIATIAGQTNLLALNATIEAARAGEAGKGFAVVAQEVKNLATQTARATEDITNQVTAIQGATKETVTVMRDISATITEINQISATIASAVEEQGAATREIARNVQEAATGTMAVTRTIENVTRSAAETGSAASGVLETAETLATQSKTLEGEIGSFLKSIRTVH